MLQVLWLRHPEERALLRGERLTGRVCACNCTQKHHNRSTQILKTPLCHLCTILGLFTILFNAFSKLQSSLVILSTTTPLPHRYVEFPIRRCRNMAKPMVDLQQACNRGPCPELPRVLPGRTTSSAVVLGWYSSPWQQVTLLFTLIHSYLLYMCIPAKSLPIWSFSSSWYTMMTCDVLKSYWSQKESFYISCWLQCKNICLKQTWM